MSALRCPRHYCGTLLDITTNGNGRAVAFCAPCERNRRGLCRDCPKPKATRSMRCTACAAKRKHLRDLAHDRARYPKRRKAILAHHKARRAIPALREHKRRYMVAYRAAHPRDGLDRAYGRAYMAARRADPSYRAKQNARKRELRALRRATVKQDLSVANVAGAA